MGIKKKRQESTTSPLSPSSSFRSSSNRRVSPATSKTTNVGCMSEIFHLMSKYHTRRKFLTFGRKQERNSNVHTPIKSEQTPTCQPRDYSSTVAEKLSLDHTPRSPAIPPDIRRSSTETVASSPRVVERLVGLDDFSARSSSNTPARVASPAAEKRRKLVDALEKCDEDLKTLKKIIEALRKTQTPPRVVEVKRKEVVDEVESEVGSEGPSPVSMLDHHHYHLSSAYSKRIQHDHQLRQHQQQKPKQHQKQHITKKKPRDHEDKAMNFMYNKPTSSSIIKEQTIITTTTQPLQCPTTTQVKTNTWSTAMKECVIEVCQEVEWGQIQQVGRIGLLIQDFILKDLIDETIKDLGFCSYFDHVCSGISSFKLPFEACKKQLCF
ncbi:uncharacterized protein LOC130826541 isoform X2 [Amaranthus tricolor]|uniref:uncharacterized protein LOC130826541 isoform X2 n=1 Tax=Amaranthus tricolor TaxID=29722 RepID=UPI00258A85F5|nr:uncharacterized protein LOC130826541 isoform X2 [Amaranthus tricolor]